MHLRKRTWMSLGITLVTLIAALSLIPFVRAEVSQPPATESMPISNTYYNNTPVGIPDSYNGSCTGAVVAPATSTIYVSDSGPILDVNVVLIISHSWVGDVVVTLQSPAGTTITLVDRPGHPASCRGYNSPNINTTLDDAAGIPVEFGNPPVGGQFRPQEALGAFNGQNLNGLWTLRVYDYVNGFTGGLISWSLTINRNTPPVASPNAYGTIEETTLNVGAPGVLFDDGDNEGQPLTAWLYSTPASGSLTLNPNGSFSYTPALNVTDPITFQYRAFDGTLYSNPATVTIYITAVNDPPVNTVPDPQSINEDIPLTFSTANGNAISVADIDIGAGPAPVQVTLFVPGGNIGTLTLNGTAGLSFSYGDGMGDAVMTFTGTIANINAALNGMVYTPPANFSGGGPLQIITNDQGMIGIGSPQTDTDFVSITINAVNDPPVNTVPGPQTMNEDTTLTFSTANGNAISVADVEAVNAQIALTSTNGAMTLSSTAGLSFAAGDGTADAAMTFQGTIANINTALNGMAFTPTANFNGSATLSITTNDGGVFGSGGPQSDTDSVNITVNPVNDAPVAVNDSYTTDEDTTLTVGGTGVLGNDSDIDGDALTATLIDALNPAGAGTLTLNTDGSFSLVPTLNYNGTATFTYLANDGTADSNTVTVTLNVTAVNDAPVAVDDAYTATEDTVLNVAMPGVLANDTDIDGDPLTVALVTNVPPAVGLVTLNADGSFSYAPAANFNGTTSFTYLANDGTTNSAAPATVTITVNAVNDAPVAVDDAYATDEDTPLNVAAPGVLANDPDIEGDSLTATLVTSVPAAVGTMTLNADGSFSYAPAANFNGTASFTYLANDGTANSAAPATVTITVNAVNDAPVANPDAYATNEDVPLTVPAAGVLANDTDVDSNPLTAALVISPTNGVLVLNSDGSFTYTPNADFNGSDSFTYLANDGSADSATPATVTITVNAVNDAPVAVDDTYATDEDTALSVPAPGVLANDTDTDGDPLTATLVAGPTNGVLVLNADGSFDYTPNADFNGIDSFTYLTNDGTADSTAPATVTITVGAVNDAPVAVDDAYTTDEDTALNVPAPGVLGSDTDTEGDPLMALLVVGPTHGMLVFNADGSFDYTPNAGFIGADSFTYNANDGTADSAVPATVTITIGAVNDVPVAVEDAYTTEQGTPLNVPAPGVLANDTDIEGDALTAMLSANATHGVLTLNADGSFSYVPSSGFDGTDTFTYRVFDGADYGNEITVTITVIARPGAFQAIDDTLITGKDMPATITVGTLLSNDNGSTKQFVSFLQPQHGTITAVDDVLTYTPAPGYTGEDAFVYTISDGAGASDEGVVYITVWKPVPACRDIGGEPNSIVYALVPDATVPTSADVFCRVLVENEVFVRPSGEIGIRDLIDLGILQAVDVFSLDTNGGWYVTFSEAVNVCLKGSGRIIFLNATGQPRPASLMPSWVSADGYTCATISNAGTVVLIK